MGNLHRSLNVVSQRLLWKQVPWRKSLVLFSYLQWTGFRPFQHRSGQL